MNIRVEKFFPKTKFGKVFFIFFIIKILSIFLPLEFSDFTVRNNSLIFIDSILFLFFSIWVFSEIFKKNNGLHLIVVLFISIPLLIVSFIVFAFLFFSPCIWEDGKITHKNYRDNSRIQIRMLNCGATTDYSYRSFYIKPITPYFNIIMQKDTTELDKRDWRSF